MSHIIYTKSHYTVMRSTDRTVSHTYMFIQVQCWCNHQLNINWFVHDNVMPVYSSVWYNYNDSHYAQCLSWLPSSTRGDLSTCPLVSHDWYSISPSLRPPHGAHAKPKRHINSHHGTQTCKSREVVLGGGGSRHTLILNINSRKCGRESWAITC